MREIRILFTGVGRRIELLQQFRQAALVRNVSLKLYGADMLGSAPALVYCDYIRKICSMRDPNYIAELLNICITDKIDMVIPTIDTDLLLLSKAKRKFEENGIKILISEYDKIVLCRDKNLTSGFFAQCGLNAPKTYNDYLMYEGKYPCFIKPKDGSSSINAFKVNSKEELKVYSNLINDYVVQEFIEGVEYTVDAFCDYFGKPVYIIPRIRQAVRAGEVLKTKIDMDQQIIKEMKQIIKVFNPCGPITIQLIKDNKTGDNYYIEINPRFGGGAPLSMKAGARSAEVILQMINDEEVTYQPDACNDGAVFSRFDQSVCIERGRYSQNIKGVIFDLDDTLYSEVDYVKSGYKKIAERLGDKSIYDKLCMYFSNKMQAIDCTLSELGKLDLKEECLSIYRDHTPEIELYEGVYDMIKKLNHMGIKVGIITDGRVEGQKNKINALGLSKLIDDIIITDELGGVQFRKPNDISFRIMQNRWRLPFEQMVYVGDNLSKDFLAPRQLGMQSIWFNNHKGIYQDTIKKSINVVEIFEKDECVIEDIMEIEKYIEKNTR